MYHSFIIHSSVDWHLCYFLAFVNSAAVNIAVHVSFHYGFLPHLFHDTAAGLKMGGIQPWRVEFSQKDSQLCILDAQSLMPL